MKVKYFLLVLMAGILFISQAANTIGAGTEPSPFHMSESATADVDATLSKAKEENKLALLVLGANWCHDSRGLAARLQSDEVSGIIADNYELLYIDIGVFEANMNIVQRFGLPVMFGTPTVLVVDPNTEKLLNRNSMNMWLDAARVSIADAKQNFSSLLEAKDVKVEAEQSPQLVALLREIAAYETAQAKRITNGYAVIAPLLQERVDGVDNPQFESQWTSLARMRYSLAHWLVTLRKEAIERSAAGEENIKLNFPIAPPLPWE